MRGLMSYVQSIKPSAIIQSNSSHWRGMEYVGGGGNVTIQSEAFTRSVTETCAELFWHIDRQGDPIYSSFILKYSRGIQGDRAVEMWSPPTIHGVDDGAVPQVELLSRVFTTIGNGGIPQLPVGWGHYADLKAAFAEIKSREPWLINTRSMKFAAVVASANTRDFYAGGGVFENYMKEIFGVYRAITEEHLPCDIIGDINLENDDLTKYKVIVLPDTGSISDNAQGRLRAYVNTGGGLIATGQPTLANVDGNMQSNFGLADALNAKYVSTHTESLESVKYFLTIPNTYHPEDTVLQHCGAWVPLCMGGGIGQGSASFYGNPVVVNPQGTATVALNWQDPQNGYSQIPAVVQSIFGTGKVTYFPSNWGKMYFKYGYPYLRRILIQEMLRVAATPPQVVVDAPMAVQANYFVQPYGTSKTRTLIHLLNDASSLARASMGMNIMPIREEVLTLSDIKVRLNDSATAMRAVAVPEGNILDKTSGPGYQEFTLPKLGLYQIISIEPESGSGAASGVFYNE